MMPRIQLIAAVALALVLALAIACNGDDNGDGETPNGGATATETPSTNDAPDGGTSTAAPGKTPLDNGGDVPTGDGQPSDVDVTPAPGGTPATFIDDVVGWLEENYPTVSPQREDCIFNPGTLITTCPGHGDFSVDPPLTGQDVSCQSLLVNDEPVAITCTSQVPLQAIYYEVQR